MVGLIQWRSLYQYYENIAYFSLYCPIGVKVQVIKKLYKLLLI
ncbi:hypothetical protein [Calothrix sp. 336/3]|nr:hypothetical protein [Calothrix sp. 336/3]